MKAQLLLESKGVHFQVIDISDPGSQEEKVYMQKNAVAKVGARNAIPPQFFNSVEGYCGVGVLPYRDHAAYLLM